MTQGIDTNRAQPRLFEEEALPDRHRHWLAQADRLRARGRLPAAPEKLVELEPGVGFVPLKLDSDRGCGLFVGAAALVLGAILGLSGFLSWRGGARLLGGGLLAGGLVLAVVGLAFFGQVLATLLPGRQRILREFRVRAYGLFLLPDAFLLRRFPERVRHRPGWCGVQLFPWSAVQTVTTKTFTGSYQGSASTDAEFGAVRVRTDAGSEEITLPFRANSPAYEALLRWWRRVRLGTEQGGMA